MLFKMELGGIRAEPPTFNMASNEMNTVNWCKFTPLRGPAPVRHEAQEGANFCVRHQRYMKMRSETADRKAAEEEALRLFREQQEKSKKAAQIRTRARATEVLIQMSEEADDDLEEATVSEGAPKTPKPSTEELVASLVQITQILGQMQVQQAHTASALAALSARAGPRSPPAAAAAAAVSSSSQSTAVPVPSTVASTTGAPEGKPRGRRPRDKPDDKPKGAVVFRPHEPDSEHEDDFSELLH